MKLYQPLHICAYLFGVFPAVRDTDPRRPSIQRFQVHWPGLVLKTAHTVLYWIVSFLVTVVTIQNLQTYQKLNKKLLTTRVLDIDELFIYMMFVGIAATTVCQAHMLWPSVTRAMNDCFHELCPSGNVTGLWQFFSAFAIVIFIAYEFAMYYIIITYKSVL